MYYTFPTTGQGVGLFFILLATLTIRLVQADCPVTMRRLAPCPRPARP
jgi:hypothetical protein